MSVVSGTAAAAVSTAKHPALLGDSSTVDWRVFAQAIDIAGFVSQKIKFAPQENQPFPVPLGNFCGHCCNRIPPLGTMRDRIVQPRYKIEYEAVRGAKVVYKTAPCRDKKAGRQPDNITY